MEDLGRTQDQSVTTRSKILDQISFQQVELERALSKASAIESEINRLKADLCNIGESLNNPRSCLNPIAFSQKTCDKCGFNGRCAYIGKGDYGRFKL